MISSGGRFETQIMVTAFRPSAARGLLAMAYVGQNALTCAPIAGSITLLVVLVWFLSFEGHAQVPDDGRYRDGPIVTGQFIPVESLSRGWKGSPEPRWQDRVSYSSDGIAASDTTAHTPALMKGLKRHGGIRRRASLPSLRARTVGERFRLVTPGSSSPFGPMQSRVREPRQIPSTAARRRNLIPSCALALRGV
jgi:hypothetical protein